jgi:hypothetical protein
MSNFMLMSLPPAAGSGAVLAPACPVSGPAGLMWFLAGLPASLVTAGFRGQHVFRGHAFAEGGSPVCFAEMPLDNRTVDLIRPPPPVRLTPAAVRNATRREVI